MINVTVHAWERWRSALLALGAQRRCARDLDRLGARLTDLGAKIDTLRGYVKRHPLGDAVDADQSLRSALAGVKQQIQEIRRQLPAVQHELGSVRLQRACDALGQQARQTYASADRLELEIAAHDARIGAAFTTSSPF